MLPWAHLSPQPKWQLDWLSHFCTAHGRVSSGMPRHFLYRKNCPLAWGDLDRPPSNTWFLGPTQILNPNVILTGSDTFAQLTAECPYTLQWAALCPSKLPIPTGVSGPHLTHDSLGSPNHTVSGSFQPSLQGSLV